MFLKKLPSEKYISTSLLAQTGLLANISGKRMYVPCNKSSELFTVKHMILDVGDQVGCKLGRGVGGEDGTLVGTSVVVGLNVGFDDGNTDGI